MSTDSTQSLKVFTTDSGQKFATVKKDPASDRYYLFRTFQTLPADAGDVEGKPSNLTYQTGVQKVDGRWEATETEAWVNGTVLVDPYASKVPHETVSAAQTWHFEVFVATFKPLKLRPPKYPAPPWIGPVRVANQRTIGL